MKKRLVLLALLLATVVWAGENVESDYQNTIPRYTDFPLDNIHILRLQEASRSLGGNVSELKAEVMRIEERRSNEILELQDILDDFKRSMVAQVSSLQGSIDGLSSRVDRYNTNSISAAQVVPPTVEVPGDIKFPPYMMILLGVNVLLLIFIIILIFWLREQYYAHRETHKEEHIHPAPPELIAFVKHQLEHDKSLRDIRMELAGRGWTPSIIEHAIHAAREK